MVQKSPSLALQLSVPSETCHPDLELTRAGVTVHQAQSFPGQFGSAVFGQLGRFIFIRTARYWLAKGDVPLVVAEELYADNVGRTDVRVVDLTWDPEPPKTVAVYRDHDGQRLVVVTLPEIFGFGGRDLPPNSRLVINPTAEGQPYVEHFFITSEQGLQLFINTLRKHNLV